MSGAMVGGYLREDIGQDVEPVTPSFQSSQHQCIQ